MAKKEQHSKQGTFPTKAHLSRWWCVGCREEPGKTGAERKPWWRRRMANLFLWPLPCNALIILGNSSLVGSDRGGGKR